MTASTRPSANPFVNEFRFHDGSLVEAAYAEPNHGCTDREPDGSGVIDLRASEPDDDIEHHVELSSGEVAVVIGANAYQPEGPMTTFFSTGSSRGTIDSWSVRIASYRTNDIVSIQRCRAEPSGADVRRPSLIAV